MKASNNQSNATRSLPAESDERPAIVVVAGPTAVGKTTLSIAMGREFGGEVVNADSRYLYRGFDIGVAKPDMNERSGVPHHLIDILSPDGHMSLARFQDMATEAIYDIHRRGKLPILVGGTPLYINAVVEGWHIPRVPPDHALRSALASVAANHGIQALSQRLQAVDPPSALRCGGNLRRIIRALEVYEATGIPMSELEGKGPAPFNALEIAFSLPRAELYRAIDRRIDDQINQGLVQEVRGLLANGVREDAPAMSSIGYRQLLPFLRADIDLSEAIERIRADTRRYVRHQETWLRRNPRLVWFDTSRPHWQAAVLERVREFVGASTKAAAEADHVG